MRAASIVKAEQRKWMKKCSHPFAMLHNTFFPIQQSFTRIRVANAAITEEFPTSILKLFIGTYIAFTLRITYNRSTHSHIRMHAVYSQSKRTYAQLVQHHSSESTILNVLYIYAAFPFSFFSRYEWLYPSVGFFPSVNRVIFPSFSKMEGVRNECAGVYVLCLLLRIPTIWSLRKPSCFSVSNMRRKF